MESARAPHDNDVTLSTLFSTGARREGSREISGLRLSAMTPVT